jgi:hypothetical protein
MVKQVNDRFGVAWRNPFQVCQIFLGTNVPKR